ncbi:MAG: hypothetical protein JXB07_06370 [Anaerolineae bacterium]|nr:hypothetical protein [Anaerolineae bacterium]
MMKHKRLGGYIIVLLSLIGVSIVQLACSASIAETPQGATGDTDPVPGHIEADLARVDELLRQTVSGNIAYNAPSSMTLDETIEIQMLLSPSLSSGELEQQIVESGEVISALIEITPQMKAVLKSANPEAFLIEALHDEPAQIVGGSEPTEWKWFVTARKGGTQELILIVYRLVEYEGTEYWRQVKSYESDIQVTVTFSQRLSQFDWKWVIGLVITAMTIPALWGLLDRRNKNKIRG